jgi:hypothetical protein
MRTVIWPRLTILFALTFVGALLVPGTASADSTGSQCNPASGDADFISSTGDHVWWHACIIITDPGTGGFEVESRTGGYLGPDSYHNDVDTAGFVIHVQVYNPSNVLKATNACHYDPPVGSSNRLHCSATFQPVASPFNWWVRGNMCLEYKNYQADCTYWRSVSW